MVLTRYVMAVWLVIFLILSIKIASNYLFTNKKPSSKLLDNFFTEIGVAMIWPIAIFSERGRKAMFGN